MFALRASDVRLRRENNATAGGYTSSVTHGATANIAEGNFDAACRFTLQGEGLQALCEHRVLPCEKLLFVSAFWVVVPKRMREQM